MRNLIMACLEVECYRKDMIEVTYRTNELPQVPADYGEKAARLMNPVNILGRKFSKIKLAKSSVLEL